MALRFWLPLALVLPVLAQQPSSLTLQEKEQFLLKARIVSSEPLEVGSTNSRKAVLSDGKLKHEVHIQTIDVSRKSYQTPRGTETNFRDSYKYNIAAYELAKILELDMIPPSVERKVGSNAAITWWVDDLAMTELERTRKDVQPPNRDGWAGQINAVRVFDQLIYNTDRNLGNLVITKDWRVWMIDHTRAFRLDTRLENSRTLTQCDQKLFAGLKALNQETLKQKLGKFLTLPEIDALLARRDLIVKFFQSEIARKGESAVLYNLK